MGIFQDIDLEWQGQTYTIKAHRVMGAILQVEGVFTLAEFMAWATNGTVQTAKMCSAAAKLLRYAGARVKDEDVFEHVVQDPMANGEAIGTMVLDILILTASPDARKQYYDERNGIASPEEDDEPDVEAQELGNSQPTDSKSASSKKRSRQRSAQRAGG